MSRAASYFATASVALLTEGVDRNSRMAEGGFFTEGVALLTEGVDRNWMPCTKRQTTSGSPSSRRAWIEIEARRPQRWQPKVALLTEGVDRNGYLSFHGGIVARRPPHGGRG